MWGIDPKAARFAWTCAMVLLLIYGAYLIHRALFVFALALMLAYLFYPLVEAVGRRLPWKTRTPAVLVPFVLVLGPLTIFGLIVRPQIHQETTLLRQQVESGEFKQLLTHWTPLGIPVGAQIVDNYSQSQIENQIMSLMPQLSRALSATARGLVDFFIVPILSFFLLRDGPRIRDDLMELLFGEGDASIYRERRQQVEGILRDAHFLILEYMRTLLLLSLTTLVTFSIVLKLIGVKYAILLALIAFPLEFVPMVGPLTAGIVIFAVSDFMQYGHLVWIVVFLLGFRLFQDYVLSPHLMHKGVKLHPLFVMFGIFAGGEIRGVPGIFLSVPILAIVRLLYYEWRKRSGVLNRSVEAEMIDPVR